MNQDTEQILFVCVICLFQFFCCCLFLQGNIWRNIWDTICINTACVSGAAEKKHPLSVCSFFSTWFHLAHWKQLALWFSCFFLTINTLFFIFYLFFLFYSNINMKITQDEAAVVVLETPHLPKISTCTLTHTEKNDCDPLSLYIHAFE